MSNKITQEIINVLLDKLPPCLEASSQVSFVHKHPPHHLHGLVFYLL